MIWLTVAAVVLAALYFWLIGQWFARVVMFPCFAAITCAVGAALANQMHGDAAIWFLAVCVGVVAAWYLSGIPVYYWRANERAVARALASGWR